MIGRVGYPSPTLTPTGRRAPERASRPSAAPPCRALTLLLGLVALASAQGLDSDLPGDRVQALVALSREGEGAAARMPQLIEALYDEEVGVRVQAVQAAGALGPVAWRTHPLLAELAMEDEWVKGGAQRFAGADARPVDAEWWRLGRAIRSGGLAPEPHLGHPHAYVRHHAYEALLRRDPFPAALVAERLAYAPARERRLASWTLARAAHRSAEAADLLEALLSDRDLWVGENALKGLRQRKPAAVVAALGDWLSSDEPRRRAAARIHVGGFGPAAAPLLPQLIDELYDALPADTVIEALRGLGPAAAPAAPYLLEVAESPATHETRRPALRALLSALGGAHAPPPAEAGGPNRRRALAVAKAEAGGGAGAAELASMVESPDEGLRQRAAAALMRLQAAAAPARERLLGNSVDPRLALQVLHWAGLLSGEDLPWIVARIGDPALAEDAIRAAGGLGEAARPAVPRLVACLRSTELGAAARAALFALGPVAGEAAMELLATAAPRDPLLIENLLALGPRGEEAVAEAIRSGGPDLRASALRLLRGRAALPPVVAAAAAPFLPGPPGPPPAAPLPSRGPEELAALLGDADAAVRASAARELQRLQQRARPALAAVGAAYAAGGAAPGTLQQILESHGEEGVPFLFAATASRDPQATTRAGLALARCGDVGIAFLSARLYDRDPRVRIRAAQALSLCGERAIDLVGPCVGRDPHPRVRQVALGALLAQKSATGRVLRHLVAALDFPDAWATASKAIGRFGEEGRGAVREAAEAGSPGARLLLAESSEGPEFLPALLSSREPSHVKRGLALALRLGPLAAPAVPALLRMLDRDLDAPTLRAVLLALASIGPAAREASLRLGETFGSLPAEYVPLLRATLALVEHGAGATPGLIEEGTGEVRMFVLEMLRGQGAVALDALALLARMPKLVFEDEVTEALAKIGKPAVPVFRDLLVDPAPGLRRKGAIGLGAIGRDAADAVGDLVRALDDREAEVVVDAARALGAVGPAAREAIPRLRLLERFPRYAKAAGAALRAIERGS